MNWINTKPQAMIMNYKKVKQYLPKKIADSLEGDEDDMYGIIFEITAFDKLDTSEKFQDYLLGIKKGRRLR